MESQKAWNDTVASARRISSSFYWPIRLMPKLQREAMWVLYAFCHAVDAIADGDASDTERLRALGAWRDVLQNDQADSNLPIAFLRLMELYHIPAEYPLALIEASIADVQGDTIFPSAKGLDDYCYGVASVVGLMTVRILGVMDQSADAYAIALGQAFQRTNMLRDVLEDAQMNRCYFPSEWLEAENLPADCKQIVEKPDTYQPVIDRLAQQADAYYSEALRVLPPEHRNTLLPTLAMRSVYEGLHEAMRAHGFVPQKGGYRLAKWQKLWRVSRTYLKSA